MKPLIPLLMLAILTVPPSQGAERICTPSDFICAQAINDGVPGCPSKGTHHNVGGDLDVSAVFVGGDVTALHHCSFGIVFLTRDHVFAEVRAEGGTEAGASIEHMSFGGPGDCTATYWIELAGILTGGQSFDCTV